VSGVVVEDITVAAGHPAVGITGTGSGVVTVTRTVAGASAAVRSARGVVLDGEDFWEDHEAPLGVEVTYSVVVDATGTVLGRAAITLTSPMAWISDPLDYTSGIGMDMGGLHDESVPLLTAGSLDAVKWESVGSMARVMGSRAPVRLGAERAAASSLAAVITTWDRDQAAALADLLDQAPIVLLRVPHDPLLALRGGGYVAADVAAARVTDEVVAWTLSGDVVAGPGLPVIIARHTYDYVREITGARTYDEVRAIQGGRTYSAVKRDPLDGLQ